MSCTRRRARIVQIHPSRRCNLSCRHCYSESGPSVTEELPLAIVLDLVRASASEGYDYLAVSGGEPLMWRGLGLTLRAARDAGMTATLTTNATLVTTQMARDLANCASFVAVSMDGVRASHDRLRGQGTFVRMQRGMSALQDAGVKTGIIWTLTQSNTHELAEVYAYARTIGAAFVQIHPLEGVGHAASHLLKEIPNIDELLVAGLYAHELRDGGEGAVPIYLDATSTTALAEMVVPTTDRDAPLSALVDPLVVRADGFVVPGNYALPSRWALGRVTDTPLPTLARHWRENGLRRWRALVEATLASLPNEEIMVNFGAHLLTTALRLQVANNA